MRPRREQGRVRAQARDRDCHAVDAVARRHAAAAVLEPDASDLSEARDPDAEDGDCHELDTAGDHHSVAALLELDDPQAGFWDHHDLDAVAVHYLPQISA